MLTRNLGADPGAALDLQQFFKSFMNLVMVRTVAQAVIGAQWAVAGAATNGWVLYLIATSAVALGLWLSALGRFKSLLVSLFCCYALMSSVFISLLGRSELIVVGVNPTIHIPWHGRYFVLGIAMVYLAFIAAVDRLPATTFKVVATTSLFWVLVLVSSQSFVLVPFVNFQWQAHASQLSEKLVHEMNQVVMIPINPPRWSIVLGDVARLEKLKLETNGYIETVAGVKVEESQLVPIPVPAGRPFRVTGWAVDAVAGARAGAVAVTVDDREQVWAHYGFIRHDVATELSNAAFEMSGFDVTNMTLPPGLHTLELTIVTADGGSYFKANRRTQQVKVEAR
jgi:hypothetical protein